MPMLPDQHPSPTVGVLNASINANMTSVMTSTWDSPAVKNQEVGRRP